MTRVIIFAAVLLLWWVFAHLVCAFVMLDWSWFTEWDPLSRGLNLFLSLYLAGSVAMFIRVRK